MLTFSKYCKCHILSFFNRFILMYISISIFLYSLFNKNIKFEKSTSVLINRFSTRLNIIRRIDLVLIRESINVKRRESSFLVCKIELFKGNNNEDNENVIKRTINIIKSLSLNSSSTSL